MNNACGQSDNIRFGVLKYNIIDVFGNTPAMELTKAAARGDTKEIERLIANKVDPNTVGKYDITPLWWTAVAENLEGFTSLLEHGANPNVPRNYGRSLMIALCQMNDARYLEVALKHGGNPNFREVKTGRTPLFEAVRYDETARQVDLLLAAGADINAQDNFGSTALEEAIGFRADYKLVYRFLQMGADYRLKMKGGQTLTDVIHARGLIANSEQYLWREKVIEFLRERGVNATIPPNEGPRTIK